MCESASSPLTTLYEAVKTMLGSLFFSSYYHRDSSDEEDDDDPYFAEAEKRLRAAERGGDGSDEETAAPVGEPTERNSKLSIVLDSEDGEGAAPSSSSASPGRVLASSSELVLRREPPPGFCVECIDQMGQLVCEQCRDLLCKMCFGALHRRGARSKHTVRMVKGVEDGRVSMESVSNDSGDMMDSGDGHEAEGSGEASETMSLVADGAGDDMETDDEDGGSKGEEPVRVSLLRDLPPAIDNRFSELGHFIPLRLSLKERKQMRLLEASLNTSNYTSKVDVPFKRKNRRLHTQLQDVCAILSGLVVARSYRVGQEVIKTREFKEHAQFFQDIFEIGRRYKIMNPERMRADYGKLMYLLQDTQNDAVMELLEFSCVRPIRTVASLLQECGASALLEDELLEIATRAIVPDGKSRLEIRSEVKRKERAVEHFAKKYRSRTLSSETIKHCLYSIGDHSSFLVFNRDPIDKMIRYLKHFFSPSEDLPENDRYSLAIFGGREGARLTHTHESQFNYALQSLMLWRDITHHFYRLWTLADSDLLNPDMPYELTDTGQGLHRVQQSPLIDKAMRRILHDTQRRVDHWVGSSVIHLGDTNVPNALMFIDKYTQVSRILNPIVLTLQQVPRLYRIETLQGYLTNTYGSPEMLTKDILADFFRSAFDGSGADNFYDAGSCIDGRLTSAWNWCSLIDTKPFYPVFKLAGFNGFDGKFG